jgi:hypothetical protein
VKNITHLKYCMRITDRVSSSSCNKPPYTFPPIRPASLRLAPFYGEEVAALRYRFGEGPAIRIHILFFPERLDFKLEVGKTIRLFELFSITHKDATVRENATLLLERVHELMMGFPGFRNSRATTRQQRPFGIAICKEISSALADEVREQKRLEASNEMKRSRQSSAGAASPGGRDD